MKGFDCADESNPPLAKYHASQPILGFDADISTSPVRKIDMEEKYYGKEIKLLCPDCGRTMKTRLLSGGWSVDCRFDSLLLFVETGENPCKFDHYFWNQILYKTEEEAIKAHLELRNK